VFCTCKSNFGDWSCTNTCPHNIVFALYGITGCPFDLLRQYLSNWGFGQGYTAALTEIFPHGDSWNAHVTFTPSSIRLAARDVGTTFQDFLVANGVATTSVEPLSDTQPDTTALSGGSIAAIVASVLVVVALLVLGAIVLVRRFSTAEQARQRRSSDASLQHLATLSNIRLSREQFGDTPVELSARSPRRVSPRPVPDQDGSEQVAVRKRVTPRHSVEEV